MHGQSILGDAVINSCKQQNMIYVTIHCELDILVIPDTSVIIIKTNEVSNTLIFVLYFKFMVVNFIDKSINIIIFFGNNRQ